MTILPAELVARLPSLHQERTAQKRRADLHTVDGQQALDMPTPYPYRAGCPTSTSASATGMSGQCWASPKRATNAVPA